MARFTWLLIFLVGCSGGIHRKPIRIGVDPNWTEIDPRGRERFLDGFTEDLLLKLADYEGVTIERIEANPDTLYDGLTRGRFDAVLSALPRYNYNLARFDVTENVLSLGPVLILKKGSDKTSLDQMEGPIGMLEGSSYGVLISPHAALSLRNFLSVPALLNAVATGEIPGALLDHLTASAYIGDLYANVLEVGSSSLTDEGIHFTTLKESPVIGQLERGLKVLSRKKRLQALREKWRL